MANTDAFALQRSNLNGFLFASVGTEAGGMPLSVLSAFARLGMDPWQEAGRLAQLPRKAAVDGLARIIALMPASPWPLPDATIIAERLVMLLPARSGGPSALPLPPAPSAPKATQHWAVAAALIGAVLAALALNLAGGQGAARPDNDATTTQWSASQPASTCSETASGTMAGREC